MEVDDDDDDDGGGYGRFKTAYEWMDCSDGFQTTASEERRTFWKCCCEGSGIFVLAQNCKAFVSVATNLRTLTNT